MKISYNWLKKYIDITETPQAIAAILTNGGLEVEKLETFESIKGNLEGVVIGLVLTCEKHPGADKLKKTTVDIGNGKIVSIVCGAPNVDQGQKVIVAAVGSTLYPAKGDPIKISKAKIRGEISEGMICASDEIGIGMHHEGIIVLDTQLQPGTPAKVYFHTETDAIFEIGLTPNRADAASHLGVARDLKALLNKPLLPFQNFGVEMIGGPIVQVQIENYSLCPRYCGAVIKNIKIAPSPEWLINALKSIGINPINNVVDITNYILYDLGQPLHAFDLGKIEGNKIIVRNFEESTPFETLDGVNRKLLASDLIISDAIKPLALAGVMGGKNSAVNENTTAVFIESAYFNPSSIRKTSLKHGLKTDASFRYERGADPEMPLIALKKAIKILTEIAGASVSSPMIDLYPVPIKNLSVKININKILQLIGQDIDIITIKEILSNLSIKLVQENGSNWELEVPSYKVDVTREADIAEEILRIYGYNNIKLLPRLSTKYVAGSVDKDKDKIYKFISSLLTPLGFYEIITNSLTKSSYNEINNTTPGSVIVLNALSEQLDSMRQNLTFSGLEVVGYNVNRQQKNIKMFEFGKTYKHENGKYLEHEKLSLFVIGTTTAEGWKTEASGSTIYDIKNYVFKIINRLNIQNVQSEPYKDPIFQKAVKIYKDGKELGTFGAIDKNVAAHFDIKQDVFHAELEIEALLELYSANLKIKELSKFPEVRRDLSLVLDKKVNYSQIEELALKVEKNILKEINVFNVYEGDKIESGKKSYSVSFILQDRTQTLTDQNIDKTMSKLILSFEKELGAFIRK